MPHEDDVTGLLVAWGQGDRAADSRLIAVVYQDLRRVARRRLRAERADHSLAPTALVHEAYLRLVDLRRVRWQNRAQFFAIAARLMRQILVDHARAHVAAKRGGPGWKVPLADDLGATMPRDVDLLDLDVALGKLATIDSRLGDLVVLRFFGGMTVEEAAESLGLSPATVKRDWSRARAWLFRELRRVVNERESVRSLRMTSDRWEHIFTLFDAALARPEAERAAFLSDHCGEDAHLRQEVESLLAAHGDADGFLSGRPARAGAANVDQSGPAPPSLTRGMRLGVFDVESFVGAGGMGEVYRARDTRLDRHVAIKVLSPDAATDPRGRARFAYEARAIARLSHPRICALHEMGHQDGVDFLVMEYLEGETLAARLRKGPMPLTQALRTAVEIAQALAAAHAQGIVHRDLKPSNVMLTAGGAKLLDFGLARLRAPAGSATSPASHAFPSSQTAPGLIAGTLPYMAPEQLEGNEVDARADIFAFGAVLYEMIAGRKAFEGTSQASVISAILSSDPPAVAVLQPLTPPALDQVIQNCLAKDRNDRWASAHDVRLQLDWIAGHPSAVTVAAGVAQNRRRELLAWTIAAMAGLALVVLWAWSLRRPIPDVRTHVSSALPPPGVSLETDEAPAISPDGSRLAVRRTRLHREATALHACARRG